MSDEPLRPGLLPNGLTIKEDNFCLEVFRTGDAPQAYVDSFDVKEGTEATESWVRSEASKQMKKPHVKARIMELRKLLETQALYSADQAMQEAYQSFDLARKLKMPGAMTNAVKLRAQLAGHLIEKRETTHKGEKSLTQEELDQMLQDAAKEAGLVISKVKDASKA